MLGNKYEIVIKAQERHIERLERMVEQLFTSLMYSLKKDVPFELKQGEPLVGPYGEVEPDPGSIYNPEEMRP